MIKLGVCFFGSRYEKTGAGKVVLSFEESKNLFNKNGIDIRMFDLAKPVTSNYDKKKGGIVKKIKSLIKGILGKTYWGAKISIDKMYFGKGFQIIGTALNEIQSCDVLIFHEIFTCYAYNKICDERGIEKKKYILVLHNNGEALKMFKIYYPKIVGSKYIKKLEGRVTICLENASKVVFVAKLSARLFKELYPKFASKEVVIYNGIKELGETPSIVFDGTLRLVTVGTVNERKNQIALVESLKRVRDKGIDAYLTIVGGGKIDECKNLASKLGITQYVELTGPQDDVASILNRCNIFIMSSFDEGLPISAIEALRSRLPLILTDVGGNSELIDGNGLLVQPTVDSLTNGIIQLSKDTPQLSKMSIRSYEIYKKSFTIESMIEGYARLANNIAK